MLTASADTIAKVTGGEIIAGNGDLIGNGLVVDSRQATPGCVFVALPGENVDGHDFIAQAMGAGARVALVSRSRGQLGDIIAEAERRPVAFIRVDDALGAVQNLASWHRGRLHASVVGVTGSTGKTTTKDFLTSVLRTSMRVSSTVGNRNNELGLPLSVLAAGTETDVVIVEMGMRGIGQIAKLSSIARPDIGLVTNVGESHMELLGSQDAVASAKGELVEAIPESGAVFLNGDDEYSDRLASLSRAPVTMYGIGDRCAVRATDITLDSGSRASFTLHSPGATTSVTLPVPGRHNVYNALAAAAVGLQLGLSAEAVSRGLMDAAVSDMRMQIVPAAIGVTIINDAYNASPSSMRAAVDVLSSYATSGRHIAVLGDMGELGSLSELAHFEVGEAVADARLDLLITVGERARRIADGARAGGMADDAILVCADLDEAGRALDRNLAAEDVVLVKASRVMGLERLVEGIVTPRVG